MESATGLLAKGPNEAKGNKNPRRAYIAIDVDNGDEVTYTADRKVVLDAGRLGSSEVECAYGSQKRE